MNIQEIKRRVKETKIETVIGRFVRLKRAGAEFKGLCPFHNEKSPSFMVDPRKGIFKCFGCGTGGDVIEFVQKHEQLGFMEAVYKIASIENITFSIEPERNSVAKTFKNFKPIKIVEKAVFERSLTAYERNPFFWFIVGLCGGDQARALTQLLKYNVGTATGLKTVFWQVDQFNRARTAAVLSYKKDGHRDKSIPPRRVFTTGDGFTPCLFGEHQLFAAGEGDVVCIVESEKTAIIADLYLPEFQGRRAVWMASCGSQGLTEEKAWALRGLNVCLVPDFHYSARAQWGLVPMRKKRNEKGILVPDESGELDEEFVSRAEVLAKLGVKVSVYDANPGRTDGGDIADDLILLPAPGPVQSVPDFEELAIPLQGFE